MTAFTEKYKPIQKIGEGSFSEVLKCEDKVTGTQYAAKRLKKAFKSVAEIMNCAEIIAMHKLSRHPNIVYMIEYFYEAATGRLIYVFELLDMSMYEFMKSKKHKIPESRVKCYLFQMLKGLEHLHKNGLFHRDIKPENILIKINVSSSGTSHSTEIVKLADLGSIRGIYSRPPYTEYISTRWYRSPECLLSAGYYGPKMDIWAAGCVFYEMLTLKPLFPGTNEIDQLSKIHNVLGSPPAKLINKIKKKSHNCQSFSRQLGCGLNALMKHFSEDGKDILKLMIQYDPENRINVRRLVDHRYFTPFRQQYLINQFKFYSVQDSFGIESISKARGDHHQIMNYLQTTDRWKQNKFQNLSPRLLKPKERKIELSKTTIHVDKVPNSSPKTAKRYIINKAGHPLITEERLKEWGLSPIVVKAMTAYKSSGMMSSQKKLSKNESQIHRYSQTKNLHSTNATEHFRKTTSNLNGAGTRQSFSNAGSPREKQFQSKSFVLPRRIAGKMKLDIVSENMPNKLSKMSKK